MYSILPKKESFLYPIVVGFFFFLPGLFVIVYDKNNGHFVDFLKNLINDNINSTFLLVCILATSFIIGKFFLELGDIVLVYIFNQGQHLDIKTKISSTSSSTDLYSADLKLENMVPSSKKIYITLDMLLRLDDNLLSKKSELYYEESLFFAGIFASSIFSTFIAGLASDYSILTILWFIALLACFIFYYYTANHYRMFFLALSLTSSLPGIAFLFVNAPYSFKTLALLVYLTLPLSLFLAISNREKANFEENKTTIL